MLYYYLPVPEKAIFVLPDEIKITESDDPMLLSLLCKISLTEALRRLANDNKAFVAFYKDKPAAFGWMAMGKALIGELNHEIILPLYHRYLWNFRTLEEFRGNGIYPNLLKYILKMEAPGTECFWILHAPENTASEKGIIKAGFTLAGPVSILANEVILEQRKDIKMILQNELGFKPSSHEPASCWKCSSPYMSNKEKECCCTKKDKVCNSQLFK